MILTANRIFLAILCTLILAASSMASNYPAGSYQQKVSVVRQQAAVGYQPDSLYYANNRAYLDTKQSGSSIVQAAWDFIVAQLR